MITLEIKGSEALSCPPASGSVLGLDSSVSPPASGSVLGLNSSLSLPPLQYSKHLFVHIGQTNPSYSDPLLEAVDIRQIYDKFPEKKGGLKELYEKGPQNAFFLVKFWVRPRPPHPNTH